MPRNIVNKPHPTPNPDKPHTSGSTEKVGDSSVVRRPAPAPFRSPAHEPPPGDLPADESTHDSCFDDLNLILSQSIQQPDPDPNLESSGPSVRLSRDEAAPLLPQDRAKVPRTSEIFRSVVAAAASLAGRGDQPGAPVHEPARSHAPAESEHGPPSGQPMLDLVVVDGAQRVEDPASEDDDPLSEPLISWSQILLLSYASAITIALIWMLWSGRWSRISPPPSAGSDQPVADTSYRAVEPSPTPPAMPIPPENLASVGQTIQVGELEVTPLTVISTPLELVRSIDRRKRRREEECLVLRLKLTNISKQHSLTPLAPNLVRERGLRPYEPYIATAGGPSIRLFPLAFDSEWAIVGQEFTTLQPGDTVETLVAAEPGSARRLSLEMTWRVRLRTGVYRTDMIGVPFSKDEVRQVSLLDSDIESESP